MSTVKKCDRCGTQKGVGFGKDLPNEWEQIDELDMCEGCMKDYRAFMRNEAVNPRKP